MNHAHLVYNQLKLNCLVAILQKQNASIPKINCKFQRFAAMKNVIEPETVNILIHHVVNLASISVTLAKYMSLKYWIVDIYKLWSAFNHLWIKFVKKVVKNNCRVVINAKDFVARNAVLVKTLLIINFISVDIKLLLNVQN